MSWKNCFIFKKTKLFFVFFFFFFSLEKLKEQVRVAHKAYPNRIRLYDEYPASVTTQSLNPNVDEQQAGAMPRVTGIITINIIIIRTINDIL